MLSMSVNSINKEIGIEYVVHSFKTELREHYHEGFHELMVVLQGHLKVSFDNQQIIMEPGCLMFLPTGSIHQLSVPSRDLIMLNLAIMPSTLEQALSYLRINAPPAGIVVACIERPVIEYLLWNHSRMRIIRDAYTQCLNGTEDTVLVRNTFSLLLPYCCENTTKKDWIETLITQMQKQENFQAGVQKMQELACCSPAHLSRIIKQRLKITPTQFVNKLRIAYACEMLKHMQYSILDICMECGFENLGYFYRCFVKEIGIPPGQYRKLYYVSDID
jgi:AraC family cel operon transcriptional repressor